MASPGGCAIVSVMADVQREAVVTLPNMLTLVRLPLAGLVWVMPASSTWITAMLVLAAVTDMADGRVARALRARRLARGDDPGRVGEAHAVGAWLDPLCDKTFVVSTLAAIAYGFDPGLGVIALIATRELILVPLALTYRLSPALRELFRFDFRAGLLGKAATVCQFAALASILFWSPAIWSTAILAGVVGGAAAAAYLRRAVLMARWMGQDRPAYDRWLRLHDELRRGAAE